jgi:hypothetical protein
LPVFLLRYSFLVVLYPVEFFVHKSFGFIEAAAQGQRYADAFFRADADAHVAGFGGFLKQNRPNAFYV